MMRKILQLMFASFACKTRKLLGECVKGDMYDKLNGVNDDRRNETMSVK